MVVNAERLFRVNASFGSQAGASYSYLERQLAGAELLRRRHARRKSLAAGASSPVRGSLRMFVEQALESQSVGIVEQFVDPPLDRLPGVIERILFRQLGIVEQEMMPRGQIKSKVASGLLRQRLACLLHDAEALVVARRLGFASAR